MYGGNGYNQTQYDLNNLRVDGRAGVDNIPMGPNGFGMFLDKNAPILWVKTTDQLMIATVKGYGLTPLDEPQPQQETKIQNGDYESSFDKLFSAIETLSNRVGEIERTVNNYADARESNTSAVRREQNNQQSNNKSGNKSDQKYA